MVILRSAVRERLTPLAVSVAILSILFYVGSVSATLRKEHLMALGSDLDKMDGILEDLDTKLMLKAETSGTDSEQDDDTPSELADDKGNREQASGKTNQREATRSAKGDTSDVANRADEVEDSEKTDSMREKDSGEGKKDCEGIPEALKITPSDACYNNVLMSYCRVFCKNFMKNPGLVLLDSVPIVNGLNEKKTDGEKGRCLTYKHTINRLTSTLADPNIPLAESCQCGGSWWKAGCFSSGDDVAPAAQVQSTVEQLRHSEEGIAGSL